MSIVKTCNSKPSGVGARRLTVSVIIPTKDRPVELERTVKSLLRQSVRPHELIIVDQSRKQESRQRIESLYVREGLRGARAIRLRYIAEAGIPGAAAARNRAMDVAKGEIWLFLDDDVELERDFVEELLNVYQLDPEVGGVSGIITNYQPPAWPVRLWTWLFTRGPFHDERQPIYWQAGRNRHADPITVRKFGSGLMSFWARAVRDLRFDPDLRGVPRGEDVDFCLRLKTGTRLLMAPRARLTHERSATARSANHWLQDELSAAHYLYVRHWNQGMKNRLCFAWLIFGYGLLAGFGSLRRGSGAPWRALVAGLRDRSWSLTPASRPSLPRRVGREGLRGENV